MSLSENHVFLTVQYIYPIYIMASTRNKNSLGDYTLEQHKYAQVRNYNTYEHSAFGAAQQTNFPGDGLLPGRLAGSLLSNNHCDIESQLFGIGTTNLIIPKAPVDPEIKTLPSLSVIDRLPVLVPEPLVVEKGQRPYLAN